MLQTFKEVGNSMGFDVDPLSGIETSAECNFDEDLQIVSSHSFDLGELM